MSAKLRPTFTLDLVSSPDASLERLRAAMADHPTGIASRIAGHHLMLTVPASQRHTWSPWLHVDLRPPEDGRPGTHVFCRFSPHANLWTAIAFTYLALATIAALASMFALAQSTLGGMPWAWWVVLACIVGAVGLWIMAQVGQRLAQDQMAELRTALESWLTDDTVTVATEGS